MLAPVASILTLILGVCLTLPAPPLPPTPPTSTNAPISGSSLMLPLEVLGPAGTTESFSVFVTNGSTATTLYAKVHGITYPGKLSLRLNGGTWFTATNTTTNANVTFPTLETALWRFGRLSAFATEPPPLSSIRFNAWTNTWAPVDGTNTFEFRFNDLDGFTIGFRVLELNLQAGTNNLIGPTQFTYDDPSTWTAPVGGDPVAGETAWRTLAIAERGAMLRAHCTDCHAQDGADLKYFNYSNRSIIERSVFHAVPRVTATNIAAYIRGLSVTFEPGARVWNPPYQPGPGVDALPVRSWAAGMGLSNVLDDDLLTLTDLFGGSITTNALNLTNLIKAREIRLALQFPDWNHWLPQIHPIDAYSASPDMATNRFVTIYTTIRSNLLIRPTASARALYFNSQKNAWDGAGATTGVPIPSTTDPGYAEWNFKERSMRHWRVVKTWELMKEFEIEDQGLVVYPTYTEGPVSFPPNVRTWFHGEPFNLSPHKTGQPHYPAFAAQSAVWYQLQLVLNDSNRHNPSIVPIDWGYQHGLEMSSWNNDVNYAWFGCEVLNIVKAIQTTIQGLPLSDPSSFRFGKESLKWVQNAPEMTSVFATIPLLTRQQVGNAVVMMDLKAAQWFLPADYFASYSDKGLNFYSNNLVFYSPRMTAIGLDPNIVGMWDNWKVQLFGP